MLLVTIGFDRTMASSFKILVSCSPWSFATIGARPRARPWLAFTLGRQTTLAGDVSPLAVVRGAIDETVAILQNERMPLEQRRREVRQLAEHNLDLARMAQASLGTHWAELSATQRDEFVPLFAAFIEAAYLNQIQDYAKLRIDVSEETFTDAGHALVSATVRQPREDPIPIRFMLEHAEHRWLVYDVTVEDVSMVQNYRTQFDRVITDGGLNRLMDRLRLKQTQLTALLGQR